MNTHSFEFALKSFCNNLLARLEAYKTGLNLTYFDKYGVITDVGGSKFVKVYRAELNKEGQELNRHIVAFVSKENGAIFKPATYRAPAKHARGNIYSDTFGMEAISDCGHVKYLK